MGVHSRLTAAWAFVACHKAEESSFVSEGLSRSMPKSRFTVSRSFFASACARFCSAVGTSFPLVAENISFVYTGILSPDFQKERKSGCLEYETWMSHCPFSLISPLTL